MRKVVCLLFVFVLFLSPCLSVNLIEVKAAFSNSVHNVNTGMSYASIQEAVNANETVNGNTITVGAGTYFEHVIVNKTLDIISENDGSAIIDGQRTGTVVNVEANNVKISGFIIQNSGNASQNPPVPIDCGIKLSPSSTLPQNAIIENNTLKNDGCGILVQHSSNNTIARAYQQHLPN